MTEPRKLKAIIFSNGGDDEAYEEILAGLRGFGYLVELVEVTAEPKQEGPSGYPSSPVDSRPVQPNMEVERRG